MNIRTGPALLLLCAVCLGCSVNADMALTAHRNIPYATIPGVSPNLTSLDIYVSDPVPDKPAPVLVWVHGGGWAIGDKANQMQYKPALFTSAGYCFVSINYRLSPRPASAKPDRIMHPVHEQDVAAALAWVHGHIAEYGGDPERIALMGHSAGAHLVSLASTDESFLKAHNLPLSTIKGTVSLDTEGYDIVGHMTREVTGIYENAFGSDPAVWKQASPATHVAPGKGMPPFLLVTRGAAVRRQLCADFASALQKAGTRAEVVNAAGYSHAEVNSRIGAPGETVVTQPLMQFLAGCFETKK
jgi:acetyl esterase/lipase